MDACSETDATLVASLAFGRENHDVDHLGAGWAEPQDGFRWLSGTRSEIWLEHPAPAHDFLLELDLEAVCSDAAPHPQRLVVAVRGFVVGRSVLDSRRILVYHLPGHVIARKAPLRITIEHEDALRFYVVEEPRERRRAPLRCHGLRLLSAPGSATDPGLERGRGVNLGEVERFTGLAPDALISSFESLGHNCEFGSLQRQCGAEPLGVFRFGAPPLQNLIECLRTRFEHFGAIENLEFRLGGSAPHREYVLREKRFGMSYHTFLHENQIDESQLLQKQSVRLRFLARKLVEDLQDGQKILVWKSSNGRHTEADLVALKEALAGYGQNTLLWVVTADADHASGTIERLAPSLLKGYVHSFSHPGLVPDLNVPAWLELCINAHALTHGSGGAGEAGLSAAPAPISPAPRRRRRPILVDTLTAQGMAHVQNKGDTRSDADGWIGVRFSVCAIEGFTVFDDPTFPLDGLTFRVVLADGSQSEPAAAGQFRGTRGMNQPLLGFLVTTSEEWPEAVDVTYEARFIDGSEMKAVVAGVECRAMSGAALEALRITLVPRLEGVEHLFS